MSTRQRHSFVWILAGALAWTLVAAVSHAVAAEDTGAKAKKSVDSPACAQGDGPHGRINSAGLWEWTGPGWAWAPYNRIP